MKNCFLLFFVFVNSAYAQHMYREAADNCYSAGYWYQTNTGLCTGEGESSVRCDYCGLYFWSPSEKNTHMETCRYRPHTIFEYDAAGNRTKRETINYHHGRKIMSYNENQPVDNGMIEFILSTNQVAILHKKERLRNEYPAEGLA